MLVFGLYIIGIIFVLTNGSVNMRTGQYAIIPLFVMGAVFISCAVLETFKKISYCSVQVKFLDVLKYIGKNSIIFLCLNEWVILVFKHLWNFLFQNQWNQTLKSVIILVVTIVAIFCVCEIINRTFIKKIFGK